MKLTSISQYTSGGSKQGISAWKQIYAFSQRSEYTLHQSTAEGEGRLFLEVTNIKSELDSAGQLISSECYAELANEAPIESKYRYL